MLISRRIGQTITDNLLVINNHSNNNNTVISNKNNIRNEVVNMINHEICSRCGRKLKTAKSQKEGFGPVCLKKHNDELDKAEQWQEDYENYAKDIQQGLR